MPISVIIICKWWSSFQSMYTCMVLTVVWCSQAVWLLLWNVDWHELLTCSSCKAANERSLWSRCWCCVEWHPADNGRLSWLSAWRPIIYETASKHHRHNCGKCYMQTLNDRLHVEEKILLLSIKMLCQHEELSKVKAASFLMVRKSH